MRENLRRFPNNMVLLEICKDGVVTYRLSPSQPRRLGAALPFYRARSEQHAKMLQVLHCKRQYSGEYRIYPFSGEVKDIFRVAKSFAESDPGWNGLKGEPLG